MQNLADSHLFSRNASVTYKIFLNIDWPFKLTSPLYPIQHFCIFNSDTGYWNLRHIRLVILKEIDKMIALNWFLLDQLNVDLLLNPHTNRAAATSGGQITKELAYTGKVQITTSVKWLAIKCVTKFYFLTHTLDINHHFRTVAGLY